MSELKEPLTVIEAEALYDCLNAPSLEEIRDIQEHNPELARAISKICYQAKINMSML
jgi:hypothetical protein